MPTVPDEQWVEGTFRDPAYDPPGKVIHLGRGQEITVKGPLATFKMNADGSIELTEHGGRQIASSPPEVAESLRQLAERIIGHPVEIVVHGDWTNRNQPGVESPSTGDTFGALEGRRRATAWEPHYGCGCSVSDDPMGWKAQPPATIAEAVGQAIGAGSTCFEKNVPKGVFDERRASLIVNSLLDQIEKYAQQRVTDDREKAAHIAKEPRLGLATTRQLVEELRARMITGGWHPEYTTVSGEPDTDQMISTGPRSASFSFNASDIGPEGMSVLMGQSPRFAIELAPSRFDVIVNGVKLGEVYYDERRHGWSVSGQRVSQPLADAVLSLVREHTPDHIDKPSRDDLGIVQVEVELGGPDHDDEEPPS